MVYVRSLLALAKPGIVFSVSFTGFAGMVLSAGAIPAADVVLLALFALISSASGAAIINNVLDRKVDVRMRRLEGRVEALSIVGERNALSIAILLIGLSLVVALYFFNPLTALLIVIAVLSYTTLYTLYLKRSSPYGTILGGLPGALPVLIGSAAVNPVLGIQAWILFVLMMLWQPPHFWSLAQMYKDDYSKAGIPVLPVAFGSKYTNVMMLAYSLSLIPVSLSLWFFGYLSQYYAISAILIGLYFQYIMVRSVLRDGYYGRVFGASIVYILGIMLAVVLDVLLSPVKPV